MHGILWKEKSVDFAVFLEKLSKYTHMDMKYGQWQWLKCKPFYFVQSNKSASSDHSTIAKKPTSGLKPGYNNSCNPGASSRHEGGAGSLSSGLSDRSGLGKFTHSGHSSSGQVKRSPSFSTSAPAPHGQPTKKHKMASLRDVSLAEAAKYGSLNDYAFFDKVS